MIPNEDVVPTGADVLFRQHSIGEIVDIRQKIIHDITKKNLDVRVLVGERYRDLIDAADTIQNMKQLVDELPSKLQRLPASCERFQPHKFEVSTKDPAVFVSFAQTKVILDITANLASLVEMRQMISSAALISLAQLALRDHNLPAEVLTSCQTALKNATRLLNKTCLAAISDQLCDDNTLSEAICTLSILEGHKPERLVEIFFNERTAALNQILDSQSEHTKEKFKTVALYIINTLNMAESLARPKPKFLSYFNSHQVATEGIVSLVEDPLSLSTKFLPRHLVDFQCILPDALLNADLTNYTASRASQFVEELRLSCRQKLTVELQCHTECRSITKAYQFLVDCLAESHASYEFLAKPPNIYEAFFQEAIVGRIAEIFEEILNVATEKLLNAVHSSFQDAARVKSSNIQNLCNEFDTIAKSALDQLYNFPPFEDVASDEHRSLRNLTSASADQKLTRVCAFVSQCVESGVRCCHFLSLLSHLTANLTTCVHLQKIFDGGWMKRKDSLLESRDLAASTAMAILIDEAFTSFKTAFEGTPTKHLMLNYASAKASVEVCAESENGPMTTTIQLPQQCLLPLNELLFRVCVQIKDMMECSVSNKVIALSNQKLHESVEEVYQTILDKRAGLPQTLQQELAFQLLFDIEYLEKLLATKSNESIKDVLTSIIDPVDYHMFRPHLDEFVVSLMAQTAMLYGLICPQGFMGKTRKQASQEHNVMLLAEQSIERFSLLPVGLPSLRR